MWIGLPYAGSCSSAASATAIWSVAVLAPALPGQRRGGELDVLHSTRRLLVERHQMSGLEHFAGAICRLPDLRGKAKLARRLQRLAEGRRKTAETWSVHVNGYSYELPISSSMTWNAAFTGHYDREQMEFLTRFISPGATVVDVGAALGLWTVPLAAKARERGGHVIAFEPMAANNRWLARNLALNNLTSAVTVHPVALGEAHGDGTLFTAEPYGGNGVLDATEPGLTVAYDGEHTEVIRLDDVTSPSRISLMKLDVEGCEPLVLRGARRILERDRPAVYAEFNRTWLARRGLALSECLAEMSELGYDAFSLDLHRVRPWLATKRVTYRSIEDFAGHADDILLLPQ